MRDINVSQPIEIALGKIKLCHTDRVILRRDITVS